MLDAIDRQIVHIMPIEPRASFRTIAEVTGISDQTAARRYRKLSESAGLRVLGVVNGPRALYEYLNVIYPCRTCRNAGSLSPPQRRAPGVPNRPPSVPDGMSQDQRICQRFFPRFFCPQDQRSMYPVSSQSRVMTASGTAASYLGTSEFEMRTARMPALLAPWMSSYGRSPTNTQAAGSVSPRAAMAAREAPGW